jgi:hypothetical protein
MSDCRGDRAGCLLKRLTAGSDGKKMIGVGGGGSSMQTGMTAGAWALPDLPASAGVASARQ